MPIPLRLLLLEDQPLDAELILHALRQADFAPDWQRVETAADYLMRLHPSLDVILADYTLPQFDAMRALRLLQERGLDIPFIVVTGSMSEEVAVECIKQGAADYVLKEGLQRLGTAVTHALAEKRLRDDKQRAEAALRDSEARYRQLVEHSPDGIAIHCQGTLAFINTSGAKLLGADHPDHLLGRSVFDFIPLAKHELARTRIQQVYDTGATEFLEGQFLQLNGQVIDVEVAGIATTYQEQPAVQVVIRDITSRKRLEAQLRQAQKMEAIGTLAGGIAHDFNNILAALLGYTELALLDLSEDSRAWHHLQEVFIAGRRAKKLVQQILTFSRQTEQESKPVQLALVVQETLSMLRASLPSTIEIRQQITAASDTVWADPTQMQQVLMNLVTNAAHAMRDTGGLLEVRLDRIEVADTLTAAHPELRPGPWVRLTVRDTGQGMTSEALERIFDPFFTTKEVHEGTGLGLAVVHGIVTGHGGAVTAASAPGQGTTFEIYLPLVEAVGADTPHPDASIPGGSEHVLFVDDEVTLARMGQEMLEHLGYTVTVRTSSIEALEAFRTTPQRFDLVITDQTMPNMTGATLVRELRSLRPDIPIILCTGFSHTLTTETLQALQLNAFLMKPLVTCDLAAAIRQVLDGRLAR